MKVYITYEKDGYNGSSIDKVFDTEEKAINYIIKNKFSGNRYYEGKDNEVTKHALYYIDSFEVE